jgi:hypothetical protein
MDIRSKFHDVVAKYGHPVLLVRVTSRKKCSCWDMQYGPDKQCPICMGNGYTFTAEKFLVRDMSTTIPETLARAIRDTDLGSVSVPSRMYYFEHMAEPDIEDLIIDCSWDDRGRPVFDKYSSVYQVNSIYPYRGDNGRIEYFRAACKYDPISVTGLKGYLTKNLNIATYNVTIGGI